MPIKIEGVVLHQYVNGNLIRVTKPDAKIQVTIKTQRLRMESHRPTAEKKEESLDAGNYSHTSSASPLAKVRSRAMVNRRQ